MEKSKPSYLKPNQFAKRELIVNGRKFESLESAARTFGMSRNTLDYRISKGWTPEQAVGLATRPDHAGRTAGVPITVQGREFNNIKEAAKYYGRAYTHIFDRLKNGCTIEQALGLVKRTDTLAAEYPELAKQWHPTKNLPLTPDDVSFGSGIRAWWLCSKGHEWQAVINSRRQGVGCAFCAGQRPTFERNFATEYPELLKEWDWDKNKDTKPESFSPRSQQKVAWKCEKGHSWLATICNRTRTQFNNDCPYCSNRALCEDNSLAVVRPDIAQDWHPTKNAPLTPKGVIAGGGKRVVWQCKHGHEWITTVGLRVNAGTGCPKCCLQTSRIEIAVYSELHALFENVAWQEKVAGFECDVLLRGKNIGIEIDGVYWHKRRPDAEITKSKVFAAEGLLLFRLREEGLPLMSERDVSFKWSDNAFPIISNLIKSLLKYGTFADYERAKLQKYVDGPGVINERLFRKVVASLPAPPPGESLASKNPEIAKEWAHDLNAPLLPEHFRPASNKSVHWRCSRGHVWKTSMNNRTRQKTGCPFCPKAKSITVTGEWNLASVHPELIKNWHFERNGSLRPEAVRPKSNLKVWWKCSEGHEWEASICSRSNGAGCPFCYGRFASKTNNLAQSYPDLLKDWDYELNKGLDPYTFTPYVNKDVWWRCSGGHSWRAKIANRTRNKSGCPVCAKTRRRSTSINQLMLFEQ